MKGHLKGTRIVAKKFIEKTVYSKAELDPHLTLHTKCKKLIDEWNDLELINKKYIFEIPDIRTVKVKGSSKSKIVEWVFIEKYLSGQWGKCNNNGYYVNKKSASIQAFCHWTYNYSNGTLLFCDAQGVRAKNSYHITDLALHSKWKGYGDSDFGEAGFEAFFENHICNDFFDDEWIKYKGKSKGVKPARGKATSYKWKTGKLY